MGPIHATAVARRGRDGWRGLLLTGPSGSGKSDMALRLMARGWRLVGDDYVFVWASGGAVFASAPDAIAGRIEARGVGVVAARTRGFARIDLVAACGHASPERMPEPETVEIAGVALPRLDLDTRQAGAVEVIQAAWARL